MTISSQCSLETPSVTQHLFTTPPTESGHSRPNERNQFLILERWPASDWKSLVGHNRLPQFGNWILSVSGLLPPAPPPAQIQVSCQLGLSVRVLTYLSPNEFGPAEASKSGASSVSATLDQLRPGDGVWLRAWEE
jgi:hypothetical protein